MITITLQCDSIEQLREEIAKFLNGTLPSVAPQISSQMELVPQTPQIEAVRPAPVAAKEEIKPFDLEVTKKRTRRTKEQIEADKLAKTGGQDVFVNGHKDNGKGQTVGEVKESAIATPTPVAAPAGYTRQNVHEALQQVNVAVGLPKSREILTSFGANRISEIKEDQFKAFVDKCNEAVMQQG